MASWNAEYGELREASAAALDRAKALLLTAQDLSARAQRIGASGPGQAGVSAARAVADATRLVRGNSARCAAITVMESEATIDRARATVRRAMEMCADARWRRANRQSAASAVEAVAGAEPSPASAWPGGASPADADAAGPGLTMLRSEATRG